MFFDPLIKTALIRKFIYVVNVTRVNANISQISVRRY